MALTITIVVTESAAPSGQFDALPNCAWMALAIMTPSLPPTSRGVTKSPTVGIMTMSSADTTPGNVSGSVTRRKRRTGPSPRSVAASISERSTFSSDT